MERANMWISETEQMVRASMEGDGTGHDWWHVVRVRNTARHLAHAEGADLTVVDLAALLHDVWDHKLHEGDETIAPAEATKWLHSIGVPVDVERHIVDIITRVSFKGAGVPDDMPTIEGKVVQDADRLDAMGAIGIARTFAYGGSTGRLLHHPDIAPVVHTDFDAYKGSTAPTLNHFHEKLLLLKDRMHTPSARAIAEVRHQYMEEFVGRFLDEWHGRA